MMLAATRTVAPVATPITLDEVKAHLRIDHDDEDTYIGAVIEAAVAHFDGYEGVLGRCLVTQTWRSDYADFSSLRLPLWPLASVTSLTYVDINGTTQTVSASNYEVVRDYSGAFIALLDGYIWPQTATRTSPVSVTAVYGSAVADVPAAIRAAVLLLAGHLYQNRESSTDVPLTEIPMGIAALVSPYRRVGV
jgi:uncharacterized phiE125 gp8 family phage protein